MTALFLSLALVSFLLSLPFPKWGGSGNLRRLAALCALLGLSPLIFLSAFHTLRECGEAGETFASVFAFLFVSVLAYGVLALHRRLSPSIGKAHGRRSRLGKRLVDESTGSASESESWDDFS